MIRLLRASWAACLAAILMATLPSLQAPSRAAPKSAATAKGNRTIYLVRHGVYEKLDARDPEGGGSLVDLGREQARRVGARLAQLPLHPLAIRSSTMNRARETAAIIVQSLPKLEPRAERDLCECTPPPARSDSASREKAQELEACRQQLDRAFERYFRATLGPDTAEVMVCHGNVIRYFVCRAMGVDPRAWVKLRIAHCSITTIEVQPDGASRVVSFDDVGHLPTSMVTFANVQPKKAGAGAHR